MKIMVPEFDSSEIQANSEEILSASAFYIADLYRFYIIATGSVDTGEFLESVHVEPGTTSGTFDEQITHVVASADHSRVIEFGWINRGKGQASYPGRYPAQKAWEEFLGKLANGELTNHLQWRLGMK